MEKEQLLHKLQNTVMSKWNWYNTWDTYLGYSIHSWLHDLLLDVFWDLYNEIKILKEQLSKSNDRERVE
jgi:hypothetical protein